MSKMQHRLDLAIHKLMTAGWQYQGINPVTKRHQLGKGTFRCTLGGRTFFIWDLADEENKTKIPMKLGSNVVAAEAEIVTAANDTEAQMQSLVAALTKCADYSTRHNQRVAKTALDEYQRGLKPVEPTMHGSKFLETVLSSGVDFDIDNSRAWRTKSDWCIDAKHKMGSAKPKSFADVIDWLLCQVYCQETENKQPAEKEAPEMVVSVWQYARYLSRCSVTEIEDAANAMQASYQRQKAIRGMV